jgi:uncharacterized protein (DUF1330 family)
MSVYLLGAIDRKDLTTYARYEAKGFESVEKYGAEGLAVCDTPEVIEGVLPGKRIVLLKFENRAALDKWYKSPEYQAALPLRHAAADTKFIVVFDGLD